MAMAVPTKEQVTQALTAVIDPELRRSIVELGMVRSLEIDDGGQVEVVVSLTTPGCPIRSHFQQAVVEQVGKLEGVSGVGVGFDVLSNEEKGRLQQSLGRQRLPEGALAQVKNVVCVASGKGGVGKSTMTTNLAAALQADGQASGVLDCDVYGYSIPRMLGVNRKPEVNAERKIVPLSGPGGIKVMSIGFFLEDNAAVVWRGPMLHKAIQQFLEDVDWGELDYLLLDLPPGTGDVSMTLAQLLPQAKVLVVTTPQPAAQTVARRAAEMAGKVDLELLGVIENMSGFTGPDGQRFAIFGEGGGQLLADDLGVPLIGKVPLSRGAPRAGRRRGAAGARGPRRPSRAGDPGRRPRHRRRHAAGAADDAGSAARGGGSGAGRRHRATGRSGLTLDPRLATNRAWWDERVPIHTSSGFYDVEGFRAGGSTLRPVRGRGGGRRLGQAPRPPPVPLRPRHALLGAPRRVGRRPRLLRPRASKPPTPSLRIPASTAGSSPPTSMPPPTPSRVSGSTSSTPASARSTGSPTCGAGRPWSPRSWSRAGSSTWPSFTPSPGCSVTTT